MATRQTRFWKLSEDFMQDAKVAMIEYTKTKNEEKLRQACEKGFGAFTQALMHYKGRAVRHKEFGRVADELFAKSKAHDILRAHRDAESLHASFYDRVLSPLEVEDALNQIEAGMKIIRSLR